MNDKELFLAMCGEFYHSEAVLHPVPEKHFSDAFAALMSGSPFLDCYIIECEGKAAGYAQLSFTWSTECGGLVVWLEELYIRESFRGKGLGNEFLRFMEQEFDGKASHIRLEVEENNSGAVRLYEKHGFNRLDYVSFRKKL